MAGYRPKSLNELNDMYDKTITAEKAIEKATKMLRENASEKAQMPAASADQEKAETGKKTIAEFSDDIDSFITSFSKTAKPTRTEPAFATAKATEEKKEETPLFISPVIPSASELREKIQQQQKAEKTAASPQKPAPEKPAFSPESAKTSYSLDTHQDEPGFINAERDELFDDYMKIMSDDDEELSAKSSSKKKKKKKSKLGGLFRSEHIKEDKNTDEEDDFPYLLLDEKPAFEPDPPVSTDSSTEGILPLVDFSSAEKESGPASENEVLVKESFAPETDFFSYESEFAPEAAPQPSFEEPQIIDSVVSHNEDNAPVQKKDAVAEAEKNDEESYTDIYEFEDINSTDSPILDAFAEVGGFSNFAEMPYEAEDNSNDASFGEAVAEPEEVPFEEAVTEPEEVPFEEAVTEPAEVPFEEAVTEPEEMPFEEAVTEPEEAPFEEAVTEPEEVPFEEAAAESEAELFEETNEKNDDGESVDIFSYDTSKQNAPESLYFDETEAFDEEDTDFPQKNGTLAKALCGTALALLIVLLAGCSTINFLLRANTGEGFSTNSYIFTANADYPTAAVLKNDLVITEGDYADDGESFAYINYTNQCFMFAEKKGSIVTDEGEILFIAEQGGERVLIPRDNTRGVITKIIPTVGLVVSLVTDYFIIIAAVILLLALAIILILRFCLRRAKDDYYDELTEEDLAENDFEENHFATID